MSGGSLGGVRTTWLEPGKGDLMHRFGPTFAVGICKRRIEHMKSCLWKWHRDEVFVKITGERNCLRRALLRIGGSANVLEETGSN